MKIERTAQGRGISEMYKAEQTQSSLIWGEVPVKTVDLHALGMSKSDDVTTSQNSKASLLSQTLSNNLKIIS